MFPPGGTELLAIPISMDDLAAKSRQVLYA